MPELPEVETIRRSLAPALTGRTITAVNVRLPRLIKHPLPEDFGSLLVGRRIEAVARRGKYLLFRLDTDQTLVVHLRMTGQLCYCPKDAPLFKYTHVVFYLDNGYQLRYADSRTLGTLYLVTGAEMQTIKGLIAMGPEPLTPEFSREYFRQLLEGRKGKIKAVLLNQRYIGGLGNIYVDESLSLAGINPERTAASLTSGERDRLYDAINKVIADGIVHGGTTVRDYRDGEGREGEYQNYLKVYGRKNAPCRVCGEKIERREVAGRGSYYCPRCQK